MRGTAAGSNCKKDTGFRKRNGIWKAALENDVGGERDGGCGVS